MGNIYKWARKIPPALKNQIKEKVEQQVRFNKNGPCFGPFTIRIDPYAHDNYSNAKMECQCKNECHSYSLLIRNY